MVGRPQLRYFRMLVSKVTSFSFIIDRSGQESIHVGLLFPSILGFQHRERFHFLLSKRQFSDRRHANSCKHSRKSHADIQVATNETSRPVLLIFPNLEIL